MEHKNQTGYRGHDWNIKSEMAMFYIPEYRLTFTHNLDSMSTRAQSASSHYSITWDLSFMAVLLGSYDLSTYSILAQHKHLKTSV